MTYLDCGALDAILPTLENWKASDADYFSISALEGTKKIELTLNNELDDCYIVQLWLQDNPSVSPFTRRSQRREVQGTRLDGWDTPSGFFCNGEELDAIVQEAVLNFRLSPMVDWRSTDEMTKDWG